MDIKVVKVKSNDGGPGTNLQYQVGQGRVVDAPAITLYKDKSDKPIKFANGDLLAVQFKSITSSSNPPLEYWELISYARKNLKGIYKATEERPNIWPKPAYVKVIDTEVVEEKANM